MGTGFDLELTSRVAEIAPVPVIAAGGAGRLEHFAEVVSAGNADAVAAASLFHYHYATPVDKPFMSYADAAQRMGRHIDSGNIDFLNHGYGKDRAITVTSLSIAAVNQHLAAAGLAVRAGGSP